MGRNLTSNNGECTDFHGVTGNTVSVPMKVSAYLTGHGDRLNSKRFPEIKLKCGALVLQEALDEEQKTGEGAWIRCWNHCRGRMILTLRFSGRHTHIPFVRARGKVQYELELKALLSRLLDPVLPTDVG